MHERPHITQPKGSGMPRLPPSDTATQVSLEPPSSGVVAASASPTPNAKSTAKQHPSPMTVALQHSRRYISHMPDGFSRCEPWSNPDIDH